MYHKRWHTAHDMLNMDFENNMCSVNNYYDKIGFYKNCCSTFTMLK